MSLKLLTLPLLFLALFHFLNRDSSAPSIDSVNGVPSVGSVAEAVADLAPTPPTPHVELAIAADGAVRESLAAPEPLVTAAETATAQELTIVTGRVIDSLAHPVAGARVSARTGSPRPLRARGPTVSVVATDDTGRFRLATTPGEAETLWLHIEAGRHASPKYLQFGAQSAGSYLPLVPGDNDVGTIVLERAGVITGRVLDTDGRPAAGAIVQIIGEQEVRTDRSGNFELVRLPPMQLAVRAYDDASLVEEQNVFVAPVSTVEGLELRLRAAPVLEGLVVDESGAPIQGARVQLESVDDILVRSATSATNGTFRVPFTHLGAAELEVQADGYEDWDASDVDLTIEPNSPVVRVVLKRSASVEDEPLIVEGAVDPTDMASASKRTGGVLHGRVLRNGAPARGAFIKVETGIRMGERMARLRGSDNPEEFLATGQFDRLIQVAADGTFHAEGLGPRLYRLSISSWSTTTFVLPIVKLRSAEVVDLGDIEVPDGGTIRGHVLLPPGVSPLGLEVTSGHGFGRVQSLLDDGARFELRGVPVGRQRVVLEGRAGALDDGCEVTVDVTSGATSDVVLDATALGLVELRLRFDLGGVDPVEYRALLHPVDDPKTVLLHEFLDAEGRIAGFVRSAGEVSLHLIDRNLDHVQGPAWKLRLVAGQSVDETLAFQLGRLTLDLGADRRVPTDGELHVRLQAAEGTALSEFRIEFEDGAPLELAEKAAHWTRLADGALRLQLDRVPVGSFDATVTMLDLDGLDLRDLARTDDDAMLGEVWLDRLRVTVTAQ